MKISEKGGNEMGEMCKVDTINRLEKKKRKEIKLSILSTHRLTHKKRKEKLLLAVRDAPDVKRLTWDRTKGVTSLPLIFC
jgi:hypothetical protein